MSRDDNMAAVELGFVEERSDFGPFPSKVGGKPAWMVVEGLPGKGVLACKRCQQPLLLLLQLSVPLRETKDASNASYHRSLYVFTCTDASCHRLGVDPAMVVLRCQLPRKNPYYPPNVDSDDETVEEEDASPVHDSSSAFHKQSGAKVGGMPPVRPLCAVCGCAAPQSCGKCRRTHYCSKAHQVLDWKTGHRYLCDENPDHPAKENKEALKILLKEFDIVTEVEPAVVPCKGEGVEKSEEEKMKEYHDYVKSEKYGLEEVKGQVDAEEETDNALTDKQYKFFKEVVSSEPEQVLRLQRGGQPLWVTSGGIPQPEGIGIPKCPHCGSRRIFEFQVMPQLLYYLKLDVVNKETLDWGTLAVYTCEKSCVIEGKNYVEEIVWKQDISE